MMEMLNIKFKMFFRDYPAVFFTLIFCPIILIIFGIAYGNEPSPIYDGLGAIDISVPAYSAIIIAGVSLVSFPISFVTSKDRGELKRLKMTPVPSIVFYLMDCFIYYVQALVGIIILGLVGKIGFDTQYSGNIFATWLGITLIMIAILSIGIIISIVCKSPKAAQAFGFALMFPMLFLSGAGTPLEMMGEKLLSFSKYIPLKYGVTLLRGLWKGNSLNKHREEIIVLGVITIICLAASLLLLKIKEKR